MSDENGRESGELSVVELCRQATDGDHDALAHLLWLHHNRLHGFVARRVGVDWRGKIDADDLLQEAYVDIFKAIATLQPGDEEAFYRWAARIVEHRFIDRVRYWRRKKRDAVREVRLAARSAQSSLNLLDLCQQRQGTPSLAVRREDAAAALMACIARLPDDHRAVVTGLYLREQPVSEVAAALNRSEDAVRRLAGRALEKLATCLGRASRYLSNG